MMQKHFTEVVMLLETDPYFGVSVFDLTNAPKPIVRTKTKEEIIEKYGSVVNFFNSLMPDGVTKIGVQPLRKNGSDKYGQSWINDKKHAYFEVDLKPKQQPLNGNFEQQQNVNYSQPSNNSVGLSVPELVALHMDRGDKARLETRNEYLETRNKELEEKIYEYKDKELKWNNSNEKAASNASLIQVAIENSDKLQGLFSSFTNPNKVQPGLGFPAGDQSEVKTQLVQAIMQESDLTATVLTECYNALGNDESANKLSSLLESLK